MTVKGYDLVGDIHGHANALHRLLGKLGYGGPRCFSACGKADDLRWRFYRSRFAAAGGSANCTLHVRGRHSKGGHGKSRIQRDRMGDPE